MKRKLFEKKNKLIFKSIYMKEYNINVYIYTYNIQYIVYMQYTVYIYMYMIRIVSFYKSED